ncbi:MAG: HPr(Ser) kinase/phosphatase [Tenericutes bacterium]|nr:HPr(Ser) kinase/phosphatase [Mycoplasmatota bacterium]
MSSITISEVIKGLKLEVVAGRAGTSRKVSNPALSKPGLEFAGMFDYYEHDRIQIIGSKEGTFFHWLSKEDQKNRTKMLFEKNPPAFVFSKNVNVPQIFIDFAEKYEIPVLKSTYVTTALFSELYAFLQARLAERTSKHGVLMDINGVGVLITGKSGLGKSEVALELIRRGYILVADDIVEVYQLEKGVIIGEAPKMLRKYLEIRGVGIVNVVYLFGVKAFRENKKISLIVELEKWDDDSEFDRLGINDEYTKIFDTNISKASIPITEARNTATLVEAAAYDFKSKELGYHSGHEFNNLLNDEIEKNQKIGTEGQDE